MKKEAAMAKCCASDAAVKVTQEAVQCFGGYGYSREYPVEKLLRDAKIFQIFEGTNEILEKRLLQEKSKRFNQEEKMDILVCMKQVIDDSVPLDPAGLESASTILNPYDGYALELALRYVQKHEGQRYRSIGGRSWD